MVYCSLELTFGPNSLIVLLKTQARALYTTIQNMPRFTDTFREVPRPKTSVHVNNVTNHRLVNMLSSTPSSDRCCLKDGQWRRSRRSSEKKHRSSRSSPWHHNPCAQSQHDTVQHRHGVGGEYMYNKRMWGCGSIADITHACICHVADVKWSRVARGAYRRPRRTIVFTARFLASNFTFGQQVITKF